MHNLTDFRVLSVTERESVIAKKSLALSKARAKKEGREESRLEQCYTRQVLMSRNKLFATSGDKWSRPPTAAPRITNELREKAKSKEKVTRPCSPEARKQEGTNRIKNQLAKRGGTCGITVPLVKLEREVHKDKWMNELGFIPYGKPLLG